MKIIYYYHIPKCGGSHIDQHMRMLSKAVKGKYYNFTSGMNNYGLVKKAICNIRLRFFLKSINQGKADFKFIHHHHGYYGISEIYHLLSQEKDRAKSLGNDFYLFTCIRDPISFQLSRVNYLRNSCGLPKLSFDDVIADSRHHNVMYRYFMQNHPTRWQDINLDIREFKKIMKIMDKVFLLEEIDDLINNIESIVGVRVPPALEKANQGRHLLIPTESQIEKLERVNHLDSLFYKLIKSNDD